MTIQYHKAGDYYLPNLVIEETEAQPIGKYGRMRKRYLKEQRPVLYTNLLLSGELFQHLEEIDKACEERMELLTQQMAKQEGVTEALKAADQMEWVRRMNSIQNRAEELVLQELIYSVWHVEYRAQAFESLRPLLIYSHLLQNQHRMLFRPVDLHESQSFFSTSCQLALRRISAFSPRNTVPASSSPVS